MYSLGMLLSFATGATVYYVLNIIWPVRIYPIDHIDAPKTREYMAKMDGLFEDDAVIYTNVVALDGIIEEGSEKNVLKTSV